MIEKMLTEMGKLLETLEDEMGEESAKIPGELIKGFLKKELSDRSGKENVDDTDIIQALFYMAFKKNLSEIEQRITEYIQNLFDIYRKMEKQKF